MALFIEAYVGHSATKLYIMWDRMASYAVIDLYHHFFSWWLVPNHNHYLNKWQHTVNQNFRNRLQWNSNRIQILVQDNAFQNVYTIAAILFALSGSKLTIFKHVFASFYSGAILIVLYNEWELGHIRLKLLMEKNEKIYTYLMSINSPKTLLGFRHQDKVRSVMIWYRLPYDFDCYHSYHQGSLSPIWINFNRRMDE